MTSAADQKGPDVSDSQDVRDRLTRVETKLDVLIASLEAQHRDQEARIRVIEGVIQPDHEERIRNLERRLWFAAGVSSILSGALALAFQYLMTFH